MEQLKKLIVESLEKDTRDDSDLFVYRLNETVDKKQFAVIKEAFMKNKGYYSKFKKGFISKQKINIDSLVFDETVAPTVKTKKVEYSKHLKDYITKDDLMNYIPVYCKTNLKQSWYYGRNASFDEDLKDYIKNTIDNMSRLFKDEKYDNFELRYIRHAIIWKSLGFEIEKFYTNGDPLYYEAIWHTLPIIKDLKMTDEAYTSMWGYDQTNVDIAYRLNKKVWGLDVFYQSTTPTRIYFVRLDNDRFVADKIKYFSKDNDPYRTFQNDASITGHYRWLHTF